MSRWKLGLLLATLVASGFPNAEISFKPDLKRQAIVDSWPAEVNDDDARADWGFDPQYGFDRAFSDYLLPKISERY